MILACTHQSHLDPIFYTAPLGRNVGYVARSTLFRNPWFGRLIRALGAVSFDREAPGPAELKGIAAALRGGDALILFPEGTRSPDGEIGRLRPGVALLAKRSGVPVVPAAIEGTWSCWPRHRKIYRHGRVRLVYGEPFRFGPDHTRKGFLAELSARLAELRDRARALC